MSFKDYVGLDFIDFLIHVGVTIAFMGFVGVTDGPEGLYPVTIGVSFIALGVRRHYALRNRPARGLTTGEMTAERIADLEARVGELEAAQGRMLELEERVDFAERLLSQSSAEQRAVAPHQGGGA